MIDFEHVTKIYKRSDTPALEDIDFHVDDGEFVFLVGHSGAGKSTLLKLILREELPTEGRVMVDGKDVARLRRGKVPFLRRQMGKGGSEQSRSYNQIIIMFHVLSSILCSFFSIGIRRLSALAFCSPDSFSISLCI